MHLSVSFGILSNMCWKCGPVDEGRRKKMKSQQETDYLGVEVAADRLLSPRLVVKLRSPLLFWVPNNVSHCLETKALLDSILISGNFKVPKNRIKVKTKMCEGILGVLECTRLTSAVDGRRYCEADFITSPRLD